ncbi:MAG: aminodeoxychorismate/anthranilate synthase component II [Dehalococcoidia bacterium]|jgi:anthranilate synthase/aminodeoxychorismate synthase-like glutamine amidotransferase|nr:MAG: anthranilate synthase / indole-3-glycerol phosphate synthase [Chloroflexota bacterium]|tara:strand:+ start:1578 stop:2153 length:576 start_codon:yes stop_codon:yes gene_type:complete
MFLLIDNYDSFTYNLYQYIAEISNDEIQVFRNDKISIEDCLLMKPNYIVISPGPRTPSEAGICVDLIKKVAGRIPLLGVCLGHQCIGQAFGSSIIPAGEIVHGKNSIISHDQHGIFSGIPENFSAIRYHSLVVSEDNLSSELTVSARSESGLIMGLRNTSLKIEGIQFHPESIATDYGKQIIDNFIKIYKS